MMTESEATERWCPFSRIGWVHETAENMAGVTYNRTHEGHGDPMSLCLGSSCMAWRWVPSLTVQRQDTRSGFQQAKRERGYCGLAGRP